VGTGIALPMLAAQICFRLGRAKTCNLRVIQKHLASMHARIERMTNPLGSIRVVNISSGKNDIVLHGEIAEADFLMKVGDWFEIGESRYVALSDEMRHARSIAMEILGIEQHGPIDDLLIAAVNDASHHILLIGENGCEQERLGRVIHHVSHHRHNYFGTMPRSASLDDETGQLVRDCRNGTLLISLYQRGKLDERLVAAITDPAMMPRLVICAPSRKKIEASFPRGITNHATEIQIPALRERVAEIPDLMDQWFAERGSPLRFGLLQAKVREALQAYGWPKNLRELRESADHFMELANYQSAHQVATKSSLTRGIRRGWMKRLKISLEFPLIPGETAH